MEIHRQAQSVRIPTRPSFNARPSPISRTTSYTSTTSSRSQDPVPIPGVPRDEPPPPLPPPRDNAELDRGIDSAWTWSNSHTLGGPSPGRLAPIKPGSSLMGGYMHARSYARRPSNSDEMDLDDDDRRGSYTSVRPSPQRDIILGGSNVGTAEWRSSTSIPTVVRRPPSPPKSNQYGLHGENPLAHQSITRSSQAYDQSLLSKIGKPPSSPPHQRSDSTDMTPPINKLSLQTRNARSQNRLTINEPQSSTDSTKWLASPATTSVSPGSGAAWRDYSMDHRSPSNESSGASIILDPELFVQHRARAVNNNEDAMSVDSRSHRGSYDQAMFGTERELSPDEHSISSDRYFSRHGTKRRAISPPQDAIRGDKSPAYTNDLHQKIPGPNPTRSPLLPQRIQPGYGSVSSASSSIRHNSYASSFAPSIAASSMTSVSSLERNSPCDTGHAHGFITSAGPVSSPATSIPPPKTGPTPQAAQDIKSNARKISLKTVTNGTASVPVSKIGSYYICECCPKKPRKFETEQDFRQVMSHLHALRFLSSSSASLGFPATLSGLSNYRFQIPSNGEAVRLSILQQPLQKQERG
jgi:hypothetical protein